MSSNKWIERPTRPEYFTRKEVIVPLGEFKERRKQYKQYVVDNTRRGFEGCGGDMINYIKCFLPNLNNTLDDVMIEYAFTTRRFDFEIPENFCIIMNHPENSVLGNVGFSFEIFNYRFVFNSDEGVGFDCIKLN